MGKSSGQPQTSKVTLPAWVTNAGQRNLAASYDVAANMAGPYSGQRVAGMTDAQMGNINSLQQNVGSTNPAFAYAQDIAGGVGSYQPSQINAGYLANTDLSSYMNPYTQNVIGSGLSALDQQRMQALNQVGDTAVRAGAFGGSRQGISEGVTNAQSAASAGSLASNLMAQNYAQAQAAATNDLQRNFQMQQYNQSAGLTGAQLNLAGALGLGTLAEQGQNAFLKGNVAAMGGQDAISAQNQRMLDAQRQYYAEQQQFPLQQLQIPLQALGMTPYGQTQTTTGGGGSSSPVMGALGGAASGFAMSGGNPIGAAVGGLAGLLGS
jgi:hypothetical protein